MVVDLFCTINADSEVRDFVFGLLNDFISDAKAIGDKTDINMMFFETLDEKWPILA